MPLEQHVLALRRCTHINNLAGLIAWLAGLLIWATSVAQARRKDYARFFAVHHLHFVFTGFACAHWPPYVCFAAPMVVFHASDFALRSRLAHACVAAAARTHCVQRARGSCSISDVNSGPRFATGHGSRQRLWRPWPAAWSLWTRRAGRTAPASAKAQTGTDIVMSTLLVPLPPPRPPSRPLQRPPTPPHRLPAAMAGSQSMKASRSSTMQAAAAPEAVVQVNERASCPFARADAATTAGDGEPGTLAMVAAGGLAACEGGTVQLALPQLRSLWRRHEWHPFTVAGVIDADGERPLLMLHVSVTSPASAAERIRRTSTAGERWSAELARLAASLPRPGALDLRMIGPLPAPPSLCGLVQAAAAGTPLLLVGGGSGLVPLAALLRRLARREAAVALPSSAFVLLVCVVREVATLEVLDSAMLPRAMPKREGGHAVTDAAAGTDHAAAAAAPTGYPWLACEIHVTGPATGLGTEAPTESQGPGRTVAPPDVRVLATAEEEPAETNAHAEAELAGGGRQEVSRAADGSRDAGLTGPCRLVPVPGTMQLQAIAAPFVELCAPPPTASASASASAAQRIRRRETASLLGAAVGFVGCAWPLLWGSAAAPLYRRNGDGSNLNTVAASGLGGYGATGVAALCGATAALWLVDATERLLLLRRGCPSASALVDIGGALAVEFGATSTRVRLREEAAVSRRDSPLEGGRPGVGRRDDGGYSDSGGASAGASYRVPVAALHRPCFRALLARVLAAHPSARIVGAAPDSMLASLDAAIAADAPQHRLVRLTHAM